MFCKDMEPGGAVSPAFSPNTHASSGIAVLGAMVEVGEQAGAELRWANFCCSCLPPCWQGE